VVGDGLDDVRQRIRQHGPRSKEEKLMLMMQRLKAEEPGYLEGFARAEKEGDAAAMDTYQRAWKLVTEQLELLESNPAEFVRIYGLGYDLET
jgi:hypothetical protein